MENKFKDNPLACLLLGIIIGGGGVLGGQAIIERSYSSTSNGTISSFYGNSQGTKSNNNFDRIPYSEDGNVLITKNGKKYHYDGCYTLNRAKSIRRVKVEDAETAGLEPCSKCN